MERTARANDTAMDPYFVGEMRIVSVAVAKRRNIVPRRHIFEITLRQQQNPGGGTIEQRRGKWQ